MYKMVFQGDKMVWLVVVLLSVFSLLVVYSSTAALAAEATRKEQERYARAARAAQVAPAGPAAQVAPAAPKEKTPFSFFKKHLGYLMVGFVLLFAVSRMPYTLFMGAAGAGFWLGALLLVLLFTMGRAENEATRSLFGFQPVEFIKVMLITYVAKLLTVHQDVMREGWRRGYLRVLWPVLLICVPIVLASNFSTAAVLSLTCFTMMFIGRARVKHLLVTTCVLLALLTAGAWSVKKVVDMGDLVGVAMGIPRTKEHRQDLPGLLGAVDKAARKTRLLTVYGRVERFAAQRDGGIELRRATQLNYAHIAIASGGLLGKGPGNSTMRYRLPEAYSDFVFAIVVEEYGMLFACLIILCYLIVLYRVGVMAKRATHFFPTLLAIGISTQIMLQALVNMCVSTGLTPVTGQNLPFISQGGSSLVATCIMFGMLLSISRSQEIIVND